MMRTWSRDGGDGVRMGKVGGGECLRRLDQSTFKPGTIHGAGSDLTKGFLRLEHGSSRYASHDQVIRKQSLRLKEGVRSTVVIDRDAESDYSSA